MAAQHLANRLHAFDVAITSSGLMAMDGHPIDSGSRETYETLTSTALTEHKAQQFLVSQALDADLVLTATRDHRTQIIQAAPSTMAKTFTLREFARLVHTINAANFGGSISEAIAMVAAQRGQQQAPVELAEDDIIDPYLREELIYKVATMQIIESTDAIASFIAATLT
ncbi:MAG: hypothetical protein RL670_1208 [Actinomycetota bacterium]